MHGPRSPLLDDPKHSLSNKPLSRRRGVTKTIPFNDPSQTKSTRTPIKPPTTVKPPWNFDPPPPAPKTIRILPERRSLATRSAPPPPTPPPPRAKPVKSTAARRPIQDLASNLSQTIERGERLLENNELEILRAERDQYKAAFLQAEGERRFLCEYLISQEEAVRDTRAGSPTGCVSRNRMGPKALQAALEDCLRAAMDDDAAAKETQRTVSQLKKALGQSEANVAFMAGQLTEAASKQRKDALALEMLEMELGVLRAGRDSAIDVDSERDESYCNDTATQTCWEVVQYDDDVGSMQCPMSMSPSPSEMSSTSPSNSLTSKGLTSPCKDTRAISDVWVSEWEFSPVAYSHPFF
ncbi:hypothetical protein DFJ77DRAFT_463626 [Powellomyces hirtus]|nr:hypothetical protein DFJ77DRAFT_463626 [Powellomyces hirtus]